MLSAVIDVVITIAETKILKEKLEMNCLSFEYNQTSITLKIHANRNSELALIYVPMG